MAQCGEEPGWYINTKSCGLILNVRFGVVMETLASGFTFRIVCTRGPGGQRKEESALHLVRTVALARNSNNKQLRL